MTRTRGRAKKARAATPKARRDTPVDVPAALATRAGADLSGGGEEEKVRTAERVAQAALTRMGALETLEQAYDAWLELKLEHAAFVARCQDERHRLSRQGEFLLGAVRSAAGAPRAGDEDGTALATRDDALGQYLRETEAKLARAREELEAELASEERLYAQAFGEVVSEIEARVGRILGRVRPALRLLLRPLASEQTILHLERVGPDEAILLLKVLAGRIPSRYGYLFDDATGDVQLPPEPLYPDEGLTRAELRPDAQGLRQVVERSARVLPVKGLIPVFVPRPDGPEDLFRLLQRGPVMEVELQDGPAFRSILSREEGERFAGHLLRLKLAGRLELELGAG